MLTRVIVLAAAALLIAGCGGDDADDAVGEATSALTDTGALTETEEAAESLEEVLTEAEDALEDALTLDLEEQNDSGISGTVELNPTSEGSVEVEIELTGSDGGPHPAHIHKGSCADLDPNPAYPLEDVVDGRSETEVDVTTADLTASEYAVNVHESAANAQTYVACADVRD